MGGWMTIILMVYFGIVNVLGFNFMGIDKSKAIHHQWRISEKVLFIIALIGGGIGSALGMKIFHHKTKRWYFRYGFPLIATLELIAIVWMMEVI